MRYKIFILAVFCSVSLGLFSQQNKSNSESRKAEFEKFKAKRVEYISSQMNLTEDESKAFWPLCDELQEKKFQLNKNLRQEIRTLNQKVKEGKKPTEAEYDEVVSLAADVRIKEAELDQEYIDKFKKVISSEKIFKYQRAEIHFARTMLDRDSSKGR